MYRRIMFITMRNAMGDESSTVGTEGDCCGHREGDREK
jgi:hypothetical protein